MIDDSTQFDEARPLVLVIDDAPDLQRLLKARLRQEDFDLLPALEATQGIELAMTRDPAIILLDLDMPGMDGFEALRVLKDDSRTLHIPVIILSGLANSQDKVTAFDLGAVDYITKPFDLTELRVRIRSALRMNRLVKLLAQRAQIDGLTGLWNRAHFDQRWNEAVANFERHGRPLSLAMIDIDHFKSINDTYGHPAGDAVLQGVSKSLQREHRKTDTACRYGGEEFALIMPDATPEDAEAVCERFRLALMEITWSRHPERTVTASLGIVGASGPHPISAAEWIAKADQNLYAAKNGGRNRIVTSDLCDSKPKLAKAG